MTFAQAIEAGFKNYVNFNGRARRSEYWYWFLFQILAQIVLSIVDAITGIGFLTIVFALATIVPGIAVSVRRMHDIDKSGWYLLIGLIPIVGAIILIIWFVKEGTPGQNQYGPSPK
jgi:uncharacterized membrane protein YhaH (DUF805 family)